LADDNMRYEREKDEGFYGMESETEIKFWVPGITLMNELLQSEPGKLPSFEEFHRMMEEQTAKDPWNYEEDRTFAQSLHARVSKSCTFPRYLATPTLCERCSKIDLEQSIHVSLFPETAQSCDLCRLFYHCLKNNNVGEQDDIQPLKRRDLFEICVPPGTLKVPHRIRVRLPALPEVGGRIYFQLLQEWLRACDGEHDDCGAPGGPPPLPTRVLNVGDGRDPTYLRLYHPSRGEKGDYLALSHCWGKPTKEQKDSFTTTIKNVDKRCQGISLVDLPRTFQDAVRVTRELGKRYLWIDSLCILQGQDGDWEKESKLMGSVFGNAYCTIAATSGVDSDAGFLGPRKSARNYVPVTSSSHGQVYVCEAIDDFHHDVEKGVLNQRAWVLQERALSRRTIHFTTRQTYFECGAGIHCETLTHMSK
jgi:hypothetical protein